MLYITLLLRSKGAEEYALDNSGHSVGIVGAGNGDLLHDGRTHSHLISRGLSGSTNSSDSRSQGCLTAASMAARLAEPRPQEAVSLRPMMSL